MRNKIIEEIYKDKQYIDYCFKVCPNDLHKDLFQYVILYLMEMPKGKLEALHESGGLRMYVARIIYINVNSPRSQFNKQYTSPDTYLQMPQIANIEYDDSLLNNVELQLKKEVLFCHQKNIYPAAVKLLEVYAELGTYQAVSKATLIPYKTVRRHIQDLTKKIRKNL